MTARYEFNFESFKELGERLKNIDKSLETELNTILRDEGEMIVAPNISLLIRTSAKKEGRHANKSKWHKAEFGNLSITIKAAGGAANKPGSWGYLVFPEEGRGPRNHVEQNFMQRGADNAMPALVEVTERKLIAKLEEVL